MVRAIVLYERAPDPERYEEHVRKFGGDAVPGATFRHGKVFASPAGDPPYQYVAEFEWPDMESFREGSRSEPFRESGKDAMEMGVPFTVLLTDLSE
jgi:hypothetical protein